MQNNGINNLLNFQNPYRLQKKFHGRTLFSEQTVHLDAKLTLLLK